MLVFGGMMVHFRPLGRCFGWLHDMLQVRDKISIASHLPTRTGTLHLNYNCRSTLSHHYILTTT
jgi:hypothetical protein